MPVGVQCPISSSLGEFSSYWDWLWCPGLSPVLVSIALPFVFHIWCFPFALICHWISIVFLLYGRRIATHSVLGLALVPDVVVPEADSGAHAPKNSIHISALGGVDPRPLASSGRGCCLWFNDIIFKRISWLEKRSRYAVPARTVTQ